MGHHAGQCSSLKNFNNAVKHMPAVKILWGTFKHKYKSIKKKKAIAEASKTAMELEVNMLPQKRSRKAMQAVEAGARIDLNEPKFN